MNNRPQNRIFLSYASEDRAFVREVYDRLRSGGLYPWMDKKDLLPGQNWDSEIQKAMQKAHFIVVFFSKHSVRKKGYVQRELKAAIDLLKEVPEDQIFVVPVRIDECEIPRSYRHLHYCDLFDGDGPDKLLTVLRGGLEKDNKQLANNSLANNPAVASDLGLHSATIRDWLVKILLGLMAVAVIIFIAISFTDYSWNPFRPAPAVIELQKIHPTVERLLDIKLRNTGEQVAIIDKISVDILEDNGRILPILKPSATYTLSLVGIEEGASRDTTISHYVDGGKSDRIMLDLKAMRSLKISLSLYYNDREKVEQIIDF